MREENRPSRQSPALEGINEADITKGANVWLNAHRSGAVRATIYLHSLCTWALSTPNGFTAFDVFFLRRALTIQENNPDFQSLAFALGKVLSRAVQSRHAYALYISLYPGVHGRSYIIWPCVQNNIEFHIDYSNDKPGAEFASLILDSVHVFPQVLQPGKTCICICVPAPG